MRYPLTATVALAAVALVFAQSSVETVTVPGTQVRVPVRAVLPVAGKPVTFNLTGTALRKKLVFSVYAVSSYVEEGVRVGSAEELAAADVTKMLFLVMEREVTGPDMAAALQTAIRANYPQGFDAELNAMTQAVSRWTLSRGDQVRLTHTPGGGVHIELVGKAEQSIGDAAFARAVWEIYLGRNNLGESIKAGLVSRL